MKALRDYAHLYLGQIMRYTGNGKPFRGTKIDEPLTVDNYNLMLFSNDRKLVLRPLSDMTEEEARDIWDSTMPNIGYKHNHKDRLLCSTHTIVTSAVVIPVLLAHGFDLFGLIEAGVAVKKVTVNTPNN